MVKPAVDPGLALRPGLGVWGPGGPTPNKPVLGAGAGRIELANQPHPTGTHTPLPTTRMTPGHGWPGVLGVFG